MQRVRYDRFPAQTGHYLVFDAHVTVTLGIERALVLGSIEHESRRKGRYAKHGGAAFGTWWFCIYLGLPERSVQRYVHTLEKAGDIYVERDRGKAVLFRLRRSPLPPRDLRTISLPMIQAGGHHGAMLIRHLIECPNQTDTFTYRELSLVMPWLSKSSITRLLRSCSAVRRTPHGQSGVLLSLLPERTAVLSVPQAA